MINEKEREKVKRILQTAEIFIDRFYACIYENIKSPISMIYACNWKNLFTLSYEFFFEKRKFYRGEKKIIISIHFIISFERLTIHFPLQSFSMTFLLKMVNHKKPFNRVK